MVKSNIDPACQSFGMTVRVLLKRHHITHATFRAQCGVGQHHVTALLKAHHN